MKYLILFCFVCFVISYVRSLLYRANMDHLSIFSCCWIKKSSIGNALGLLSWVMVFFFSPEVKIGSDSTPYSFFQRSCLCLHAFHCTDWKDPNIHVLYGWIATTETYQVCTALKCRMWLFLSLNKIKRGSLVQKITPKWWTAVIYLEMQKRKKKWCCCCFCRWWWWWWYCCCCCGCWLSLSSLFTVWEVGKRRRKSARQKCKGVKSV